MSIRKRLYGGFGLILTTLLLLLFVNLYAGVRVKSAQGDNKSAFESLQTIQLVQQQIMHNRLNLDNFLLSGDPRDEERVVKGVNDLTDILKRGESQTSADLLRTALIQVESTEASWNDNFAKPLLAKRHQVDSGDSK